MLDMFTGLGSLADKFFTLTELVIQLIKQLDQDSQFGSKGFGGSHCYFLAG